MSIRSFLDIRYSLPGFSFMIFVAGIALSKLPDYLNKIGNPTTSIVMGLLALASGSPLGFLLSQTWYISQTKNWFGFGIYGKNRKYIEFLHKEGVIEDEAITINVLDYLYHQCDNQHLKDYVNRRWNMYNIFGSTIMAIIIGIVFGLFFRNHIETINVNIYLLFEKIIIVLGIVLVILFNSGKNNARTEHEYMVLTIIRNVVEKNRYWKEKFPKSYFSTEEKSDKSKKKTYFRMKK